VYIDRQNLFVGLWVYSLSASANEIAVATSRIRPDDKVVINEPILPFDTVCKWSQLTAHSFCIPSIPDNNISLGIDLIVEVMGATVTSPK